MMKLQFLKLVVVIVLFYVCEAYRFKLSIPFRIHQSPLDHSNRAVRRHRFSSSALTLRNQPHSTILYSTIQGGISPKESESLVNIFSIPGSSFPKSKILTFTKEWALEKMSSGFSIDIQTHDDGVHISFKQGRPATLSLFVKTNSQDDSTDVNYSVHIPSELSPTVQSLISNLANSMVDNFQVDLLDCLLKKPEEIVQLKGQLHKEKEQWNHPTGIIEEDPKINNDAKNEFVNKFLVEEQPEPDNYSLDYSPKEESNELENSISNDDHLQLFRKEFGLSNDIEITDVDDVSQINFKAIQEEQREISELQERMKDEKFWENLWEISTMTNSTVDMLQENNLSNKDDTESQSSFYEQQENMNKLLELPVIQEWVHLPHNLSNGYRVHTLVEFVQQWAESYGQKGVGLDIVLLKDGCRVMFGAVEEVALDIRVFPVLANASIRIVSDFHLCDILSGTPEILEKWNVTFRAPMNALIASLQVELQKLDVINLRDNGGYSRRQNTLESDLVEKESLNVDLPVKSQAIADAVKERLKRENSKAYSTVQRVDSIEEKEEAFREVAKAVQRHTQESTPAANDRPQTPRGAEYSDPLLQAKGRAMGVDVAAYNTPDIQAEAVKQLNTILRRTREQGYFRVLQEYDAESSEKRSSTGTNANGKSSHVEKNQESQNQTNVPRLAKDDIATLFTMGKELSELNLQNILDRPSSNPYFETAEELMKPPPQFPVQVDNMEEWISGKKIDIFAGPFGMYQNTADPREPSLRDKYEAQRLLQGKPVAEPGVNPNPLQMQNDFSAAAAHSSSSSSSSPNSFLSVGDGLTREEKQLLLESMHLTEMNFQTTGRGMKTEGPTSSAEEDAAIAAVQVASPPVEKQDIWKMEAKYLQVKDRKEFEEDSRRFDMLLSELEKAPVEVHGLILNGFKDVLLSDHCLLLLKLSLAKEKRRQQQKQAKVIDVSENTFHHDKTSLYAAIASRAAALHDELKQLVESESVRHYQTIAEICEISVAYQKEDPVAFLDHLDALKPKFDTDLLAFVNHNLYEEEFKLKKHEQALQSMASRGTQIGMPQKMVEMTASIWLLPPEEEVKLKRWVTVLKILRQGIAAELERRFEFPIEMLTILIRFFDPTVRLPLWKEYVAMTPTTDLHAFRSLAVNMIERLLDAPTLRDDDEIMLFLQRGGGGKTPEEWRYMLECLRRDIDVYLSEEVIAARMNAYSKELAEEGVELAIRHRNPLTQATIESVDRIEQMQFTSQKRNTWLPTPNNPQKKDNANQPSLGKYFPTI